MEDRFTFAGQDVFMSLGLLNELTSMIGEPGRVAALDFDPALQEQAIKSCLAKRTGLGRVTEEFDLDKLPGFSVAEAEAFISWIKEHVIGFFIRRLTDSANLIGKHKGQMTALEQFTTGSASAASPI